MQVVIEEKEGLERELTITNDALIFDEEFDKRVKKLCQTQRIDGFRTGKIPVSVILKRFSKQIEDDISNELAERYFYEAVMAEKIKPASKPTFEHLPRIKGEEFAFKATFERYPEVTNLVFDALEIERIVVSITDKDLNNMINTLRKQQATWKTVERKSQDTDRVTIDFIGTVDGEIFQGGKAEAFKLELGSKRMIPGFESGIIGNLAGTEFVVDLTFPADYQSDDLKGKDAKFAITLKEVEEQILPEINDEFVKKFGIESGGEEVLRSKVKENMQRELSEVLNTENKNLVVDALIEKNEIIAPKGLVEREVEQLRQQLASQYNQKSDSKDIKDIPDLPAELFTDEAEKRVKIILLLAEVIKINDLKLDNDKVKNLIELAASAYDDPSEIIEYYNKNENMLRHVQDIAIEEQAVEFIIEHAKINNINKSFDEVIKKRVT
ncbi:MAG: trigger factor [Psychromonas sp.]|nr:trigger factor [Psychromonas sp.]